RVIKELMDAKQAGQPNPHPDRILKNVNEFPQLTRGDYEGHAAWNDWPWKLHRIEKGDEVVFELYRLDTDPMETKDLAAGASGRVEKMKAALEQWQSSVYDSWEGKDYLQQ
ncbi:MAG: hypothetical protein P1V20_29580, partial [Verrucomicrobiales bacterium]|nr:hypothetical protein [Verrucomicrobiales bacterium]